MAERSFYRWTPLEVPGNPKVSLAVAAYQSPDSLAGLIYALKGQTYSNWEAIVIHDGPGPQVKAVVESIREPRVRWIETEERRGHWGHPWRQFGIDQCTGQFIGLTNDDNWYAPTYFEWMLHQLSRDKADFAYCNMVHSHQQWKYFPTRPKRGCCDLGAWIGSAELVRATPWPGNDFESDGDFIEALAKKARRTTHVPGCLFVHN
jgi:glycosyltransferase involved in cell wall biosynthesis